MISISWLHLTDFHQGMRGQDSIWPTLRTEFFDDLERLQNKIGVPWDLVLFSGDLTQTGKAEEFRALEDNLAKLWEHLEKLGSTPTLLAVPGNHDLVRPHTRSSAVKAFSRWWDDPDIADEFWKPEANEYNQLIQRAFSPYLAWQQSSQFHSKLMSPGYLPGDFAFTFERDGVRLGLVGLNSAFLQLTGGNYEGRLALDARQFQAVCQDDSADWIARHDAALLLTHHPKGWLHSRARRTFEQDIMARDNFTLHLHGHMHDPASESMRQGGGAPRRHIQGASLFGLEEYGESDKVQRIHGYGAGRLDFEGNEATLHYWPRIATVKQGNYRKLGADPHADLDESEKWSERVSRRPTRLTSAKQIQTNSSSSRYDTFLRAYRQRLSANYERWDLQSISVTQPGGEGLVTPNLSDMYLPLRLGAGVMAKQQEGGSVLSPEALIREDRPIVIRGSAGAGKTTWMRFTFRALLQMEGAIPFMLVLRDLARRWSTPSCQGQARSLDAYLQSLLEEHVTSLDSSLLGKLLKDEQAPRPILLVDGWDEVGPLAEELRAKLLGFMRQYPRVLVIATSRPYGEGQPTNSEGFNPLDIQTLSDNEIQELSRRFFTFCYGMEQEPVPSRASRFWTAVRSSESALQLARTPLLLTMMLFVSRSRPLPDKRHQLYQACIENLLSALPKQKEEEGALHPRQHWRPDDAEERMRVVAGLASTLHLRRVENARPTVVTTLDDLEKMLPGSWPQENTSGMSRAAMRRGFIYWLAGPAGLLSERADGTLSFVHLSFQEFLVAWHLNATVEGKERITSFTTKLRGSAWTEVLRLWAALLAAQSNERLNAVLDALAVEQPNDGIDLLGFLFADGLGPPMAFETWLARFMTRLEQLPAQALTQAQFDGWATSNQEQRRARLIDSLKTLSRRLPLIQQLSLRFAASNLVQIRNPLDNTLASAALTWLDAPNDKITARSVAAGRVFSLLGSWPEGHEHLSLLHAWPCMRRIIGIRHQLAILCGVRKGILARGLRGTIERYTADLRIPRSEFRPRIEGTDSLMPHTFLKKVAAFLGSPPWVTMQVARGQSSLLVDFEFLKTEAGSHDMLYHIFIQKTDQNALPPLEESARLMWMLRSSYGGRVPYGAVEAAAEQWGVKAGKSWLYDYATWDSLSCGLHLSRHFIATHPYQSIEGQLISTACKESLSPGQFAGATNQALSIYGEGRDPLWPALARHLIREATAQDRVVLEEAIRSPDKWAPPLSWGLRFIVRGDLMLEDGTEVQLDELSQQAGLEHLPMLEETAAMPELSYEEAQQLLDFVSNMDLQNGT